MTKESHIKTSWLPQCIKGTQKRTLQCEERFHSLHHQVAALPTNIPAYAC